MKKYRIKYKLSYVHTMRRCISAEKLGEKTFFSFNKGKNVLNLRKIKYTQDDDSLYLNIYEPKEKSQKKLPVFLYLHGGGWISGSPEGREAFTTQIASQGYFVISLFYGLSPKYHHPEPVENAYKAIEWLIDHADEYNVDISEITVGGESAGAHLSAMMGAISSNPDYKALFDLPEKSKNIKIKALVLNCGVYEMSHVLNSGFKHIKIYIESYYGKPLDQIATDEKAKEMSPIYYVTPQFPRSFVITAENDKLAPSSYELIEKFKECGVKYTHFHGTGMLAVHAFAVVQIMKISQEAMEKIKEFLKEE